VVAPCAGLAAETSAFLAVALLCAACEPDLIKGFHLAFSALLFFIDGFRQFNHDVDAAAFAFSS
jgi:hypothetical protein